MAHGCLRGTLSERCELRGAPNRVLWCVSVYRLREDERGLTLPFRQETAEVELTDAVRKGAVRFRGDCEPVARLPRPGMVVIGPSERSADQGRKVRTLTSRSGLEPSNRSLRVV